MCILHANIEHNQLTGGAQSEFRLGWRICCLTNQGRSQCEREYVRGGVKHGS
jgi:hypothetical protein